MKKPLIISHCNVRSLLSPGTLDEITILIENHKMDILSISETWLDSHIPDQLVSLHGFTIIRKDRIMGNSWFVGLNHFYL